jgi:hypothetical protein
MKLGTKNVDGIVAATRRMRPYLLLGLCLLFAGASSAQARFDPKSAMAPAQLQHTMSVNWPSLPAAKTTESKAASSAAPAKGAHEGIKVHGHWVIDVRNPDGTQAAHREFENSLAEVNGGNTLVAALSGSSAVGGWGISVSGSPSPCSTSNAFACEIVPPQTSPGIVYFYFGNNCSPMLAQASPQPFCYANAKQAASYGTFSPSGIIIANASLTLSGAAYVDTTTTITDVGTFAILCPGSVSPSSCLASALSPGPAGGSGYGYGTAALTDHFLSPGIPVSAGQIVQVSVTLTFS